MKKGSFTPTRTGLVRADCVEDEDGNWYDDRGRIIYKRQGNTDPGAHVHLSRGGLMTNEDEGASDAGEVQGTGSANNSGVSGGRPHVSFADPTFAAAWGSLSRRSPARVGAFQAELFRLGCHRLQNLR